MRQFASVKAQYSPDPCEFLAKTLIKYLLPGVKLEIVNVFTAPTVDNSPESNPIKYNRD
jgi:hypothetical protein